MNKERYNQIIDDAYKNYSKNHFKDWEPGMEFESKESFINKIKTDRGFSDKWGLKIEERELDIERRYNIWFNNNFESGMERHFDPNKLPNFDDPYWEPTPTREVLVTYKDEQIKFYE